MAYRLYLLRSCGQAVSTLACGRGEKIEQALVWTRPSPGIRRYSTVVA